MECAEERGGFNGTEKVLNELEERYNIRLNKKTKIKDIDKQILDKVAKTHFKNVAKYAYQ